MSGLPRIAISMGDAGGVGPELVLKVLAEDWVSASCRPVVVGDPTVLERAAAVVGRPADLEVVRPEGVEGLADVPWGAADVRSGAAAGAFLRHAFELGADGVVSAPMCKETFHEAGYDYLDELEFLADVTGSPEPILVGVADPVWTVAATLHVPLAQVPQLVTRERVAAHALALHGALTRAGRDEPRLAVAALNPHGGEGGLLGREEIDVIAPGIEDARAAGVDVTGPVPADTVFVRAFRGEFSGVVCMYHDQANIARKLQGFGGGATLFLGLPVVCATTAHGTAFDLAGRGVADPGSLSRALSLTVALAAR